MFNGTAVVDRFALRRLLGMRKLLVLSGVILGLVAPSAASATITSVFGTVTCTTQGAGASEGQRWCGNTANTTVPSWDGTPIDVSAAFPPATGADNNYPVVGIYHGWGSSKILPSSATAQRWLKLGYAVFSMTDRGWFSSCGATVAKEKPGPCEKGYVHLMARAYEVHDAQYLLGLLADEGVINPQEIAATGESYGGGMSEQLGSLKDRVQLTNGELIPWTSPKGIPMKIAATAPEWPWTDLAQSLQPNGSNLDYVANAPYSGMLGNHEFGIEKQNWNESLYLAGLAIYKAFYAPAPAEPEANITEWYNFNATGGPYNGKPLAIQQETQLPNHSPYYTSLAESPAPALLQNGWNDDLFPVNESVDYYNKVRATYPNTPIQLFAFDYGHNPRSTTSPSTTDVGKLTAAQNAWFEYYVKGQGSEPANAHGGVTALTSVCPTGASSSGHEYKAANWASLAPGEIRLEGAAEQTIEAPGTAPTQAFYASGTTVCAEQNAGNNASAATYKLAPAPAEGFTIAGSPTVIGEFSTPAENDQVIARLYDVNEGAGGTQRLIGRAIYRPISPGAGFTKQVFQLHPQAWNVAAGHVVKLELLMQDSKYARNSSTPASIQVKNLELRLPTTEAPGSDGGLVQAPLPKYLPPGYTLARNVATTVPGVPYVSSGGNPNTGVFTLSWEPSEAGAGLTYTLQQKLESGSWITVATGLTSPEYAFTAGNKEAEGVWTYRVSASNESAESEYSGASAEVKVNRSAPVVATEPASSVTQTGASLNATVNPKDETVSDCHFEYGTTVAYGTSVPCSSLPGSGESPVAVSATLSPGTLSENTTYHYRIVATNTNGTSYGSDVAFTTLPNAPAVVTGSASSVTRTSATLNATVNPEGATVTDCHFEYGTSEAYGSSVACSSLPGSGESPVGVSASVSGLSEGTTYFFRIVATNAGGTSYGGAATFATLTNPTPPHWYKDGTKVKQGVKVPVVSWGGAVNVAQTSGSGEISCRTIAAGTIENPVGGGAGVGQTQASGFFECSAPQCEAAGAEKGIPAIGRITSSNFPWKDELTEGGSPNSIREKIGVPFSMFGSPEPGEMVRKVSCETPPGYEPSSVLYSETLEGQLEPEIGAAAAGTLNGTSSSKPSGIRYAGSSSGALHSQLGGEATSSGTVKYMGYNGQEVLTVGAP